MTSAQHKRIISEAQCKKSAFLCSSRYSRHIHVHVLIASFFVLLCLHCPNLLPLCIKDPTV
ncbi:hypothetical protein BJX76DRAFT_71952 [Aspergillus varians]